MTVALNFRGSYYEIWQVYEALGRFMEENGYQSSGY